jgi:glycosyltransferase involved in cell wall biosynthesis
MVTVLQLASKASGGGLERLANDIGDEVDRRGWRSVFAFYDGEPPIGRSSEFVRLRKTGMGRGWPGALARWCSEFRPDIVHLHDPGPGSLGAIAAKAAGVERVVYSDHTIHRLRPWRYRAARSLTARLPTVNVAVSRAVARSLHRDAGVPRARIVVIRNGTDLAPEADLPDGAGEPRLLYVANLWPWKGHGCFIEAIGRLVAEGIPVTAEFAGEGEMRRPLEEMLRSTGLERRVRLLGRVDDPWEDPPDLYVHPSAQDGLPLALLEAMMRGLPVIASRIAGIPEVVRDGENGWLVPPNDPEALAVAIAAAVADPERARRLGRAGRATVMSDWLVDRMIQGHMDLYERVLDGAWS